MTARFRWVPFAFAAQLAFAALALACVAVTGHYGWMLVMLVPVHGVLSLWSIASDKVLLRLFLLVLPLTALELLPYSYATWVFFGGGIGLMAVTLAYRAERGLQRGAVSRSLRIPLILLGVLMALSAIAAVLRGLYSPILFFYTRMALGAGLICWTVASVPDSVDEYRRLTYCLATGFLLVCLVLPFFAGRLAGGMMGKSLLMPFGVVNLNVLAAFAGTFLVVALGAALDRQAILGRALLVVVASGLTVVLAYSKSRGAWIAVVLVFIYLVVRTRKVWLFAAGIASAVGVVSLGIFRSLVAARVEATSAYDPALWARFLLWKSAWDVFRANWLLGVGWENFRYVKHLYGFPWPMSLGMPYNTNNLYLEFSVGLGVFGLAAFVWLLVAVVRSVDRIARARRSTGYGGLEAGIAAGIMVFSAHGLLDCVTWQPGVLVLLAVLIGMASGLDRLDHDLVTTNSVYPNG